MEGNNTYWVCSLNSHNNPVKQVLLSQVCKWGDGGGRGQEPAEGQPRRGASHPSRSATASSVPLLPKWCLCSPFQVHGNGILDGTASFREAEWRCEKLRVPPIPGGVTVLSFTSASIKMKAAPPPQSRGFPYPWCSAGTKWSAWPRPQSPLPWQSPKRIPWLPTPFFLSSFL